MPSSERFVCGVIEGFYGKPWSEAERFELFDWMGNWRLNSYLYAPKDDLKHRALWRQTHSPEECEPMPVPGWEDRIEPFAKYLQVPVTATFGLVAVFACFSMAYALGQQLKQEAIVSASLAALVFLLISIRLEDHSLNTNTLGSQGLFAAVLVPLVSVRVQKFFNDRNLVIKLPESVPAVVYESFLSLVPMIFLVVVFWAIRYLLGFDINGAVQKALAPLLFA